MQEANARFQQTDDPAESMQPVNPCSRFLNVIKEVEQTEEEFVAHAHDEQHRLRCVVESEDRVTGEVNGLVTG